MLTAFDEEVPVPPPVPVLEVEVPPTDELDVAAAVFWVLELVAVPDPVAEPDVVPEAFAALELVVVSELLPLLCPEVPWPDAFCEADPSPVCTGAMESVRLSLAL